MDNKEEEEVSNQYVLLIGNFQRPVMAATNCTATVSCKQEWGHFHQLEIGFLLLLLPSATMNSSIAPSLSSTSGVLFATSLCEKYFHADPRETVVP